MSIRLTLCDEPSACELCIRPLLRYHSRMTSHVYKVGLLSVVLGVGCGSSRRSECEAVRDRQIPIHRANVEEALTSVADEYREMLRKRGYAEIAAFEAKFVGECVKHDKLELTCFEDPNLAQQDVCKPALEKIWAVVYADILENSVR